MPAGTDEHLIRNYRWKLAGPMGTYAHFSQCSGVGVRVATVAWREAGVANVIRRLPGRVEYANLTLAFGVATNNTLWQWLMDAVEWPQAAAAAGGGADAGAGAGGDAGGGGGGGEAGAAGGGEAAPAGSAFRRSVTIEQHGASGLIVKWNLFNAWPCEWNASPLDALGSEVAIERITLCYERVTREVETGGGAG